MKFILAGQAFYQPSKMMSETIVQLAKTLKYASLDLSLVMYCGIGLFVVTSGLYIYTSWCSNM